jgi:hypothetical protein
LTCNGARGRAITSIQNNTPENTRVIPVTLLRRRLARYRSVIRNLQVTPWYGARQRFPPQRSSLSYIGNATIAGMRLVGRGKKGTNAVSRESQGTVIQPESLTRLVASAATELILPCGSAGKGTRRSPAHRSASPGTSPQGRGSLRQTTDRAAARNSRTPFGRSDAARQRRR